MRSLARTLLARLPIAVAVAALVHPLASLGARWDWRLDLISHFQEPALAVTIVAALLLLARRHRRAALAFAVLAIFQVEPVARYSFGNPVPPADPDGPRLRVLVANVLATNEDPRALDALIREADADVVALVEVSDEWAEGLTDAALAYPHRLTAPAWTQGLALWFKAPPIAIDPPSRPSPGGWPYLHARFAFDGRERHLWLLHPRSPFMEGRRVAGFPELDELASRIARTGGSTIVVGDLNTTDGSPHFRDFLKTTGLRDSRRGFGRQESWPIGWPYQIAIDHALVSPDWAVLDREQGPDIGSDHRPFRVDLTPSAARVVSAVSTRERKSSP